MCAKNDNLAATYFILPFVECSRWTRISMHAKANSDSVFAMKHWFLFSSANQGVKEEPAKPKEVKSAEKAGWLKKSSGKFLSSYKDRYIQLDRTAIAVYENEVRNQWKKQRNVLPECVKIWYGLRKKAPLGLDWVVVIFIIAKAIIYSCLADINHYVG